MIIQDSNRASGSTEKVITANGVHQFLPVPLEERRSAERPFVKLKFKPAPVPENPAVKKPIRRDLDCVAVGLFIVLAILISTGVALFTLWEKLSTLTPP